jgi:hypothetical protein
MHVPPAFETVYPQKEFQASVQAMKNFYNGGFVADLDGKYPNEKTVLCVPEASGLKVDALGGMRPPISPILAIFTIHDSFH